ncbi:MAG: TetR family transcriptional regulator [Gemmatimonadetes bacterium]|nr:TetR family transcriptional regulator [Gemmatimonadota bacterium]
MPYRQDTDRRVQHTRSLLHRALASLVHEKPYDEIVVRDIVARADVGRTTFYAHYRDKDELLEQGIRAQLCADARPSVRWTTATERLLRFSLPFLEHVECFREHETLPLDAGTAAPIHDRLRRILERVLVDELRVEARRTSVARDGTVPADLLARHVAATFVLALEWWLQHPDLAASDVDARFRALVVPVLGAVLGA